jgi:4-carboxymuconolactone decarboxylase
MKRVTSIAIAILILTKLKAQDGAIFPTAEKSPNNHHVGNVWLSELAPADSTFAYNTTQAVFDPGARLDWHIHPGGQILLITDGIGFYQEKGKAKQTVRKGDVIKCKPGVEHWHGATLQSGVTYLATSPVQNGKTIWLKRVTDHEYGQPAKTSGGLLNDEQKLIDLSKKKWQWMADKKADTLANLFHEKSTFVHMGGAWGKDNEVSVIRSGGIHYKKADVHEVSVKIIGNTAIVLSKITLLAAVGGNEVTNPFMVTEAYVKQNNEWKLCSLSFTKLLTAGN